MCDECQQHIRNQLKHVSMNNWVLHYLTSNSIMTYATSGQEYLLFPYFTVGKGVLPAKECMSCNLI